MLRPPVVRAAALALLLAGAAPTLALAAGDRSPRPASGRLSSLGEVWSSVKSLFGFLGPEMDPNGLLSTDSGQEMDQNGASVANPDLGQEMDPDG